MPVVLDKTRVTLDERLGEDVVWNRNKWVTLSPNHAIRAGGGGILN